MMLKIQQSMKKLISKIDKELISYTGEELSTNELYLLISIDELCIKGEVSLSKVISESDFSKSMVSSILRKLDKNGYTLREIESDNRRKVTVRLLEKADEKVKLYKEFFCNLSVKFSKQIGMDELQIFDKQLKSFANLDITES